MVVIRLLRQRVKTFEGVTIHGGKILMPVMNYSEKEKVFQNIENTSGIFDTEKIGTNEGNNHVLWTSNNTSQSNPSYGSVHEKQEPISEDKTADNEEEQSAGKKKTPMCLINELARHYKLQPQYRLIEESGPAHQKTFVVCLKLDQEEYVASGQSIKKAQHAAAQQALEKTSYHLPEVKPKTKNAASLQTTKPVTPTVALNALAMKVNLTPVYVNLPMTAPPEPLGYNVNGSGLPSATFRQGDFRLNHNVPHGQYLNADFENAIYRQPLHMNQRAFYNRRFLNAPKMHCVSLTVGDVTVTGEGPSPQAARHDAAQKALNKLNEILPPKPLTEEVPLVSDIETEAGLKSPVSLAHELALKLNQTIEFILISESGPPHMRTFVVQCKLGNFCSQGEGNCKKLAKKKAAECILEEWKNAHPKGSLSPSSSIVNGGRTKQKPKSAYTKKKPKNLVKDTVVISDSCAGSKAPDPISQLVQLQQARKEKEPLFTLISEKGQRRQPEFVMQVTVGSVTEVGVGLKKKDAKRAAALKALESLGALTESPRQEIDRAAEIEAVSSEKSHNGLLVIGSQEKKGVTSSSITPTPVSNGAREQTIASHPPKTSGGLRPEIRLRYLAQVLEYEVEFSDFPKGKKGEYVTLVTLNTNPPQVSHGLGSTLEEAHDNAASNMLQLIAEGALDSDDLNKESSGGGV